MENSMNFVRITTTIAFIITLSAVMGCSKKEKAAQPQAPLQAATTSSKKVGGQVVALPQDDVDVVPLKAKVLTQFKAGDFVSIYKDASEGFKKVGSEDQFVTLWKQQLQQTGKFKDAKEISHTVRPTDKFLVFIYKVQYEKANKAVRFTFGRSGKGKLELTGINQSDPK
jgi:hypothetical protein